MIYIELKDDRLLDTLSSISIACTACGASFYALSKTCQ